MVFGHRGLFTVYSPSYVKQPFASLISKKTKTNYNTYYLITSFVSVICSEGPALAVALQTQFIPVCLSSFL